MKKNAAFTILYIILVALDGLMSFTYYSLIPDLVVTLFGSAALSLFLYFLSKKKEYFIFYIIAVGILLFIFYGYNFSVTKSFFPGMMALISAFFVGSYILEIINYYGRRSKP